MHTTNSITLTIDDDDPSGLWNVMSQRQQQQRRAGQQQQQQRRFIRFGFNFFQVNRTTASSSSNNNDDANHPDISIATSQSRRQQLPREVHHSLLLRPHGPVPQGGTLEDLIILPSSTTSSSSSAVATIMTMQSSSSSSVDNNNSRMNKQQQGLWSNVRSTMRGIRHTIIQSTVSTFSHDDSHHHRQDNMNNSNNGDNNMMMMMYNNLFDRRGDGAAVNNRSVLRVGGMIHRHLLGRESKKVHQDVRGGYYDDNDASEDVIMETSSGRVYINKANVVTAAARGGGEVASSSLTTTSLPSSSASTSPVKTSHTTSTDETTFIIETPLFPIILPKAWEAPFKGTSSYSSLAKKSSSTSSTTTSTTTPSSSSSSLSYMESLEITIAPPEDTTTTTIGTKQPTPHQLQSATLPLIPKSTWESFTGNEFFHPETYDGLVSTGVLMGSTVMSEEYVNWSGDKKTDKFIKEHNNNNDGNGSNDNNDNNKSSSWYEALDSSQEVLVWSGKFIGGNDLYGAELPIIKTTSIIHKSPKYLAELLMDSTKVKAYNKMSLGREDVEVFQSGVDTTVDEGKFGNAGESKIVRNLTRPPMVNSNLEFVSEYLYHGCCYCCDIYLLAQYLLTHLIFFPFFFTHIIIPSLHARTQTKPTRLTNTLLQQQ